MSYLYYKISFIMKSKLYLFFFFFTSYALFAQSPVTRLNDTYCFNYNLPALNSNFFAIKKGGIDGYIFDVENQTKPLKLRPVGPFGDFCCIEYIFQIESYIFSNNLLVKVGENALFIDVLSKFMNLK